MMLIIIIAVLFLGLWSNAKIYYWSRISRKGFASEVPVFYLKYPRVYDFVDIIIFLLILKLGVPWYIVIALYYGSFIFGGKKAERKYTEIVNECEREFGVYKD